MEQTTTKPKKSYKFAIIIVIAVFIAFFAGIMGEIFTRAYLSKLQFFSDLYFTDTSDLGNKELIIRDPRKVVVEQDLRVSQLTGEIQPSVLSIFKKRKISKLMLDNIYSPNDYLGQSVALTSDGWLMAIGTTIDRPRAELSVYYNNKAYDVEKIVVDAKTNIAFLKINVQNLPVIKLSDVQKATLGQQLFIFNTYWNQLYLANIVDKNFSLTDDKYDFVSSSESLTKKILLNKNFSADMAGTVVFNLQGEVLGFLIGGADGYSQVVPVNYISPILNQVLKGEAIARPYLGINYINLAKTFNLQDSANPQTKGIMIWPNRSGVAINTDSPLAEKLLTGDVILSLENQTLDADNELSLLLLSYKTGQEVRLKYLRDGKEAEISVILK